jgi:hypothetical protein
MSTLTIKIQIDQEKRRSIKDFYGKGDHATIESVVLDILQRYMSVEYYDPNLNTEDC